MRNRGDGIMRIHEFLTEKARHVVPAPVRYYIRHLMNFRVRGLSSAQYWTRHNVSEHRSFQTAQQSLDYLEWRNSQYLGHIDLMPVDNGTGKAVLDYGCGPGNDLVGFALRSKPARLVGADVSSSSLAEAKARLMIHGIGSVELIQLQESSGPLPFDDRSIDIIHSAGVLHHLSNMDHALREFRRIVKDNGHCQIMVYNYNSIWMQLYAGHIYKKTFPWKAKQSKQAIFKITTDGEECPIVNCFTPDEFCAIAARAGFIPKFLGASISVNEMIWLGRRFEALKDQIIDSESRTFLSELTFNDKNIPLHQGAVAGIGGCYRLTPA
jgi:ubiquinone/menaquinone biosynthesis C-methylase UbiE